MKVARELFGQRRYEEISGALWLARSRLARLVTLKNHAKVVVARWEEHFRRVVEEGRYREGRSGRKRRVARMSEIDFSVETHVRRQF